MLHLTIFDAMGPTDPAVIYETTKPKVTITADEMRFRAKILEGRFAGDVEVVTLEGRFNRHGDGRFDQWDSRVNGDLHYRIELDQPIRFLSDDLAAAAGKGIAFRGNDFNNMFDGDIGRDVLKGGRGDDRLRGLNGVDKLIGDSGDDLLAGGNGNDGLTGGRGDDGLDGGKGNDRLNGGAGRDLLIGGAGVDLLAGGAGVDRFRFKDESDSRPGRPDRITDFQSDLIDLSSIDARSATARDNKFVYIGGAEFSGQAGELRFENSTLQADTTGDGHLDFELFLANDIAVLQNALIL